MKIKTPGRICLFGEHQDYLGLPVIAMAISKFSSLSGVARNDAKVVIRKPDINNIEEEIGDLLITIVNLARFFDISADLALRKTNQKFINDLILLKKLYKKIIKKLKIYH